jgi:TonB family protein
MRPHVASNLIIALVVSFASACAAHAQDVRARPPAPSAPPMPRRAVTRDDAPAEGFKGIWTSDKYPAGTIQIVGLPGGGIGIVAAGRFEAVGYTDGRAGVALAAIPRAPASMGARVRYGVLRIERRDERALQVRFADDLNSPVTADETWTFRGQRMERSTVVDSPEGNGDELPRFGPGDDYVEELPEAVVKVPPVYPPKARTSGIEGQVLVQALVGKDGLVKDVRVGKSIPELDDAAIACVRQWRFKPALSKGAPVEVWVAVPVKFALH